MNEAGQAAVELLERMHVLRTLGYCEDDAFVGGRPEAMHYRLHSPVRARVMPGLMRSRARALAKANALLADGEEVPAPGQSRAWTLVSPSEGEVSLARSLIAAGRGALPSDWVHPEVDR